MCIMCVCVICGLSYEKALLSPVGVSERRFSVLTLASQRGPDPGATLEQVTCESDCQLALVQCVAPRVMVVSGLWAP
jgi:hypothetical protein